MLKSDFRFCIFPIVSSEYHFVIRRLPVPHPNSNNIPNVILWSLSSAVEHTHCQSSSKESHYHEFVARKIFPSNPSITSLRLHPVGSLNVNIAAGGIDSFANHSLNDDAQIMGYCDSVESLHGSGQKEKQRRRKPEHGNKGNVPWNKGRKHTAEARILIKQRTIKVLRDPKVSKKMSEHPRSLSDQTKARIRSSLQRVGKRLKWKQLREKFFVSWLGSIARAAKKGGSDQQELEWGSYDKIKQEIVLQQLQWDADKAKAKEMSKMRRERIALARAEKTAGLAQRKKEREEKAKQRREEANPRKEMKRKTRKKSNKIVVKGLKLKQRLTKIHKNKIINVQATIRGDAVISHTLAWEKPDIELVKREKVRSGVSLADQIQAAKNRRAEPMAGEVLIRFSPIQCEIRGVSSEL
ncbi:LOW QUALITY PROTEIN: hypothetical protein CFOL_v3_07569 [Cephalotus follicularis]|uniref:Nuclease associated modular domain-containing protein n=1 Tax=Cephalotus follicularis TaxID=3775 RepID=A0A1Q3B7N1_CEPFO|nr:LOW QUALITY PROTEIN: hypothetical protein CFOL_v3_07569 [Cephalotus follicularis]